MKNLFKSLGIIALVAIIVFSMMACATTGIPQIDYSKIIDVPKMSKDDLFVKTNLWAVGYFNKADSVIEYSDKGAGIISGKFIGDTHYIMGGVSGNQSVKSVFTISVKDEKVKLDLKPAEFISYTGNGQRVKTSSVFIKEEEIIAEYNATLESLKKALINSSNW